MKLAACVAMVDRVWKLEVSVWSPAASSFEFPSNFMWPERATRATPACRLVSSKQVHAYRGQADHQVRCREDTTGLGSLTLARPWQPGRLSLSAFWPRQEPLPMSMATPATCHAGRVRFLSSGLKRHRAEAAQRRGWHDSVAAEYQFYPYYVTSSTGAPRVETIIHRRERQSLWLGSVFL